MTITKRVQEQPTPCEIARAEVGHIPAQAMLYNLLYLRAFRLPVRGQPGGKRRQEEAALADKAVGRVHDGVDLRAFHQVLIILGGWIATVYTICSPEINTIMHSANSFIRECGFFLTAFASW